LWISFKQDGRKLKAYPPEGLSSLPVDSRDTEARRPFEIQEWTEVLGPSVCSYAKHDMGAPAWLEKIESRFQIMRCVEVPGRGIEKRMGSEDLGPDLEKSMAIAGARWCSGSLRIECRRISYSVI
jgi:hypothetical protein